MKYVKNGFTLINLLVVIVIISILSTITIYTYINFIRNAHRAARDSECSEFIACEKTKDICFSANINDASCNDLCGMDKVKDSFCMIIPSDWGNTKGSTITSGELHVENTNGNGWNQWAESLPFSDSRNFELRFKSSTGGLAELGLAESKDKGFKAGLYMQQSYLRRIGGGLPTEYLGRYNQSSRLVIRKFNNTISYIVDDEVLKTEQYSPVGNIVVLYYGIRWNEVISLLEIVWI